jgi:hypothetical protein
MQNGLNFLGLTDHDFDLNVDGWTQTTNAAAFYLDNLGFAALFGFEYSNDAGGHVAVVNVDSAVADLPNRDYDSYEEFCAWLGANPDVVAV